MIGAANKSTVYGIRRSVSKALTEESAEEFSLSSRQGRRGLGRGGSFFLWLACASAVGCPSPRPSPRSFLTGRGSWRCRLSCSLLSTWFNRHGAFSFLLVLLFAASAFADFMARLRLDMANRRFAIMEDQTVHEMRVIDFIRVHQWLD